MPIPDRYDRTRDNTDQTALACETQDRFIERVQAYLRHSARQQYEPVRVAPFTLFFHPTDDLTYFNYAIPDSPCAGDLQGALSALRAAFTARGRRPRFEFLEAFAPALPAALRAAGFVEEARQPLMVCTPDTFRPAPAIPGLSVAQLTRVSSLTGAQRFLAVQRQGFDPGALGPVTEADARYLLQHLGSGRAFLARLAGEPAGTALYAQPFDRLTELMGIATLEPFRRRGIGSGLTALALQDAFERGVEAVCLTAADARAGRIYERTGFRVCATALAYVDAEASLDE